MGRQDQRDWGFDVLRRGLAIDAEELRLWREAHPRTASNMREAAEAKVDGRKPDFGPVRAYL